MDFHKFRKRGHAHKHIHKTLRKHAPKSVHHAKKFVSFKYPKLLLLIVTIIAAYFIFKYPPVQGLVSNLSNLKYLSTFISGILISFGFSAPFSIGFLLTANVGNIFLASAVGGIGAMIGDLIIFRTIKNFFMKEFNEINKTHIIKKVEKIVEKNHHVLIRHYLLYIFAGILIAAPILPDEIGVSMLAGLTTIKSKNLAAISFVLHTLAIMLLLYLGIVF